LQPFALLGASEECNCACCKETLLVQVREAKRSLAAQQQLTRQRRLQALALRLLLGAWRWHLNLFTCTSDSSS
jgi:hypothetical protein